VLFLRLADTSAVMRGNPTANFNNLGQLTQQLRPDDIAGARFCTVLPARCPIGRTAGWHWRAWARSAGWRAASETGAAEDHA